MKVRYSIPALADLSSIFDYVTVRSPQGAKRIQARIRTIIDLLLLYPFIGTSTDDSTIRRLPTRPYPFLVFYEVTETEIIVHAVRHVARDSLETPGSA